MATSRSGVGAVWRPAGRTEEVDQRECQNDGDDEKERNRIDRKCQHQEKDGHQAERQESRDQVVHVRLPRRAGSIVRPILPFS